jgi:hypothetical protein
MQFNVSCPVLAMMVMFSGSALFELMTSLSCDWVFASVLSMVFVGGIWLLRLETGGGWWSRLLSSLAWIIVGFAGLGRLCLFRWLVLIIFGWPVLRGLLSVPRTFISEWRRQTIEERIKTVILMVFPWLLGIDCGVFSALCLVVFITLCSGNCVAHVEFWCEAAFTRIVRRMAIERVLWRGKHHYLVVFHFAFFVGLALAIMKTCLSEDLQDVVMALCFWSCLIVAAIMGEIMSGRGRSMLGAFRGEGWVLEYRSFIDAFSLSRACCRRDWQHVKFLLELGADVDKVDGSGRTPLGHAVGDRRIMWLWLDWGVDPSTFAVWGQVCSLANDTDEVIAEAILLLNAGAKVNGGGANLPPLCYAAGRGSQRLIKVLLAAGADPTVKYGGKWTAFEIANRRFGCRKCADWLRCQARRNVLRANTSKWRRSSRLYPEAQFICRK